MKAISLFILVAACASHHPKEDPHDFIRTPLLAKVSGMRDCYMNSSHYLKNEGAEIRTKIEFEIQKDGSTTDHKILESSLNDEKFKQCLVSNLKSLKYPPQTEVLVIEQPFNFFPRKP